MDFNYVEQPASKSRIPTESAPKHLVALEASLATPYAPIEFLVRAFSFQKHDPKFRDCWASRWTGAGPHKHRSAIDLVLLVEC